MKVNLDTVANVVPLDILRSLRSRAEALLDNLMEDLRPFQHKGDGVTFLRTPESPPLEGDVNVTTTCSCVMALAFAHQFRNFYGANADHAADQILTKLIEAPWMSSGLVMNNAFTTTLVLRTLGFLAHHGLLAGKVSDVEKKWDLSFEVGATKYVAEKLRKRENDGLRFLYR